MPLFPAAPFATPGFEEGLKVFLPPVVLEQLHDKPGIVFPLTFGAHTLCLAWLGRARAASFPADLFARRNGCPVPLVSELRCRRLGTKVYVGVHEFSAADGKFPSCSL